MTKNQNIDWNPHLENDLVELVPMRDGDFERLFAVAADPAIWAIHPIKDRYKRERFEGFFESGLESGTCFLIIEKATQSVMGSTRFYDFDAETRSVCIGYTFLAVRYWGGAFNGSVKRLMLDYAFQFVDFVDFHVGKTNIRSQKAVLKLGATQIGEEDKDFGSDTKITHVIFRLSKADF